MTDPVNLDNLREMTGGDKDLEKELFSVYISSAEACLNSLRAATDETTTETWRTQAHAWKGMSLNLGAENLGALCASAQMAHTAPKEEKLKMLASLEEEYAKVKVFLEKA